MGPERHRRRNYHRKLKVHLCSDCLTAEQIMNMVSFQSRTEPAWIEIPFSAFRGCG
jgi:hypothetical protein